MKQPKQHIHRAILSLRTESAWTHCITPDICSAYPNRAQAHGGLHIIDRCNWAGWKKSVDSEKGNL